MCLVAITCALRWGVTHVGEFNYWALLTLSRENYFRYRECSGRRRSLEVAFEKKTDMWLRLRFCKNMYEILHLKHVCIKSDVTTLETIVI